MRALKKLPRTVRRFLPGRHEEQTAAQSVHYNCVCDEDVALRCANDGCARRIEPNSTMMVAPDGSVLCSEGCAAAIAGATG